MEDSEQIVDGWAHSSDCCRADLGYKVIRHEKRHLLIHYICGIYYYLNVSIMNNYQKLKSIATENGFPKLAGNWWHSDVASVLGQSDS